MVPKSVPRFPQFVIFVCCCSLRHFFDPLFFKKNPFLSSSQNFLPPFASVYVQSRSFRWYQQCARHLHGYSCAGKWWWMAAVFDHSVGKVFLVAKCVYNSKSVFKMKNYKLAHDCPAKKKCHSHSHIPLAKLPSSITPTTPKPCSFPSVHSSSPRVLCNSSVVFAH